MTELDTAIAALIKIHKEIQSDGGFDSSTISASTNPLADLPGFDSLLVPVAYRLLAREFDLSISKDAKIPNIYAAGKRKLTIAEIAAEFCRYPRSKAA